MAQANRDPITFRVSSLIRDPVVRAAFRRAERDLDIGDCLAETDHPPCLDSGAAELLTGCGARRVRVPEVVS